jgi:SM-20-related protein
MLDTILQKLHDDGKFHLTNLLDSSELALINAYFEEKKKNFLPAKVGHGAQRIRNESIRGDYTLWLDPKAPPEIFQKLTLLLGNIQEALNSRYYFGLRDFEYHLAYYPSGFFYSRHTDAFGKDPSRVVSFIFYLNETWKKEDGGELVIYNHDGHEILETISPMPGSLVIFLSREFPHEVLPCRKERRSLTGWMHNKLLD